MTKKSKLLLNDQTNKDIAIDSNNVNSSASSTSGSESKRRLVAVKAEYDEKSESKMLDNADEDEEDDDDDAVEPSIGRNSSTAKYKEESNSTSNPDSQEDSLEYSDDDRKWSLDEKLNDLNNEYINMIFTNMSTAMNRCCTCCCRPSLTCVIQKKVPQFSLVVKVKNIFWIKIGFHRINLLYGSIFTPH